MGVGGGGISRRAVLLAPRVPLQGIRLSPDLWPTYEEFATIPALIRDGRVQRSQTSFVVAALTAPVTVQVVDDLGAVYASGVMLEPWATPTGSVITLNNTEKAGVVVTRTGTPDPFWKLRFVGSNGSWVSGSFGFTDSTAEFRWGLPTFEEGQKATFALSKISVSTASNLEMPKTPSNWRKTTYLFCDSVIAGVDA